MQNFRQYSRQGQKSSAKRQRMSDTSHKYNYFPLSRSLESSGYILIVKTDVHSVSSISGVYSIESMAKLEKLKETIERKKLFGHVLYVYCLKTEEEVLKRVMALHTFVNGLGEVERKTYTLNNVIPRRIRPNDWISGIFIGDKSIEENWDFNNFDDLYVGGIVEIRANFEIPDEIAVEKRAKTVGIYLNTGVRAVLKTERVNVNDLSEEQKKKYREMNLSEEPEGPVVSVLLQNGAFVWLEAMVEFHTYTANEANTGQPIEDLLKSKKFDPRLVPILLLNKSHSTDWGIQIKPVIQGIYDQRVVTIEAPHGWESCLTVMEWNAINIGGYVNRNNREPDWKSQGLTSLDSSLKKMIERNVKIDEWIKTKDNYREYLGRTRLTTKQFPKVDKVLLYIYESNEKIEMKCRLEPIAVKKIVSETGRLFVLNSDESLDELIFSLSQNGRYGTHLFVTKYSDNEYMQIQAIICGRNDDQLNRKPIDVNDVLWKGFASEDNIWFIGLLIGGIDVIRKRFNNPNRKSTKKTKVVKTKDPIEDNSDENWKLKAQLMRTRTKKNEKNRETEDKKPPLLHQNWSNCIEIMSNYIIPKKREDLPFDQQVIGIYIPSGVRCLLINGITDRETFRECRTRYQMFHRQQINPILLQEKTFLWIEGRIEFNLLEDPNLCYQPLERTLIKQLVSDKHIVGDIEGMESEAHLLAKVLFLRPPSDQDVLWSIEVSPLIYPSYESRVLSINIPIGGQIEIQDWDQAFESTIDTDLKFAPNCVQTNSENQTEIKANIPLRKWMDRNFKSKVYQFIDICVHLEILIRIPNTYRRNALKTRESLKKRSDICVKNYANFFFLYKKFRDSEQYWFVIRYRNLYLDHLGLMKFDKNKITLFESEFKRVFYDQLI